MSVDLVLHAPRIVKGRRLSARVLRGEPGLRSPRTHERNRVNPSPHERNGVNPSRLRLETPAEASLGWGAQLGRK